MLIDKDHPAIQALLSEVSGKNSKTSLEMAGRALSSQRRLVETVATLARGFLEELVLTYHVYELFREGKEPQTICRVQAAELSKNHAVIDRSTRPSEVKLPQRVMDFLPRYQIPAYWQLPLYPQLVEVAQEVGKGSELCFLLERRGGYSRPLPDASKLLVDAYVNLADLEHALFFKPVNEDRRKNRQVTLQAGIVLGIASVKEWLAQYHSLETYEALMAYRGAFKALLEAERSAA